MTITDRSLHYTIPSDNRELQQYGGAVKRGADYTIPSDNRELQPPNLACSSLEIIPYQVITGNYNVWVCILSLFSIIPYQVITGNYNRGKLRHIKSVIIPYQVITGNYNF